jgi:hypothetical protein
MATNQIDVFLNEALENFSHWLKSNKWRGKEHDCVNLFAHKFLFEKIAPDEPIHTLSQIRIECGLKQPGTGIYNKKSARKDLVIWDDPHQNSWSDQWEPINIPKVVMEWKVKFRPGFQQPGFNTHDIEWIRLYSEENPSCIGCVVLVDLTAEPRKILWQYSKQGALSGTFSF